MDDRFREAGWPGELLRLWRDHLHLTQVEVAQRLGNAQQTVADLERGRSSPSVKTLARLANVGLLISTAEFFAGPPGSARRSFFASFRRGPAGALRETVLVKEWEGGDW